MPYFIFLHDCDDFQIDIETFHDQLQARWPKVDFENQMPDDFIDALSWWASSGELRAWGGLTRDLRGVWLEDAPEPFAAFAIWFAGIMPLSCKLFLFHDNDGREIELARGTSEAQLLAAIKGQ